MTSTPANAAASHAVTVPTSLAFLVQNGVRQTGDVPGFVEVNLAPDAGRGAASRFYSGMPDEVGAINSSRTTRVCVMPEFPPADKAPRHRFVGLVRGARKRLMTGARQPGNAAAVATNLHG